MDTIIIGFINPGSKFLTKQGEITLSGSPKGQNITSFLPAIEREGIMGILRGTLHNSVLHQPQILELAPSWMSHSFRTLITTGQMSWTDLEKQIMDSKDMIFGPQAGSDSSASKPHLVIDIGHSQSDPGACSAKYNICEFAFNTEIANLLKPLITGAKVTIISRDNNSNGFSTLPAKINALNPDFIISLHVNAAGPTAQGTEMLYFHSSTKSHNMAKIMQRHVLAAFGFRNRYTKPLRDGDRGVHLLKATRAPCIITEPFFFSNDSETATVLANKMKLVNAYKEGIEEIISSMFS